MMGRAEITQRDVWLIFKALVERERNIRLADSGVAHQHHHLAFSQGSASPLTQKQRHLFITPKQRRQRRSVRRIEAALDVAALKDLVNRHWLRKPFEGEGAEITVVEMPRRKPARALADQDSSGLRQRLQPSGEVRAVTHRRVSARWPRAYEIANNRHPCRNAYPHL